VNRNLLWTDPVMKFIGVSTAPRRIVGVVADIDDENVIPNPTMTVYHPLDQEIGGGRLFVHAQSDPYALLPPITKIIRDLSPEQPVEQAATLDDVRAEVLAPDRLNALVFGVQPRRLLTAILGEGAVMAGIGVAAGAIGGAVLARLAASYVTGVQLPGWLPLAGASLVLVAAAILASLMPAARASRVDVMQALRSE